MNYRKLHATFDCAHHLYEPYISSLIKENTSVTIFLRCNEAYNLKSLVGVADLRLFSILCLMMLHLAISCPKPISHGCHIQQTALLKLFGKSKTSEQSLYMHVRQHLLRELCDVQNPAFVQTGSYNSCKIINHQKNTVLRASPSSGRTRICFELLL
ncbi:hypothetical protein PMAYCL1PPCAC_13645 [Pristionchus mayeri]|uniref:Uncharacterized protein n=1 Tax=Pristionchus mayeri TaxID=1317129 RepID=A0AAN4ZTE1_9BILA|nr:hypothetical protein PMAYCL1PPCAC_13640 [Pristionchus mayeri]GMR43450.1 hypothetical protein PMAYCL1PPCAC_13645 [Pristionchus mayeri]